MQPTASSRHRERQAGRKHCSAHHYLEGRQSLALQPIVPQYAAAYTGLLHPRHLQLPPWGSGSSAHCASHQLHPLTLLPRPRKASRMSAKLRLESLQACRSTWTTTHSRASSPLLQQLACDHIQFVYKIRHRRLHSRCVCGETCST